MKKILSLFLLISLIFSLSACSNNNQKEQEILKENEEIINKIEEQPVKNIKESNILKSFKYKLAKAYEGSCDENNLYKSQLIYILEYVDSGYNGAEFRICTKEGIDIGELEDEYEIKIHKGRIYDEDISLDADLSGYDYRTTYTIIVSSKNEKITFDDFVIESNIYFNNEVEKISYKINTELSNITSKQKNNLTSSIINVDDSYYIVDNNTGSGGINNHTVFKSIEMKLISGEPLKSLSGKVELADKEGNAVEIPDGCEFYYKFNQNNLEFGLSTIDKETILTKEQEDLIYNGCIKYTDLSGYTMYFF